MKLETDLKGEVIISQLLNGATIRTSVGPVIDAIGICERDGGFEIRYHGKRVDLKQGEISIVQSVPRGGLVGEVLEGPGNEG